MSEINPEKQGLQCVVKIEMKMHFFSRREAGQLIEQMRHAAEALGRPMVWQANVEEEACSSPTSEQPSKSQ